MALKMVGKPKTVVVADVAVEPEVVQTPPVEESEVSEVEALTAEYVELYKKFDFFEVKTLTKRMDDIRKQLQSVANETMDAKKPAIFVCAAGEVEFSERGKTTEIPNPLKLINDLMAKFGPDVTASVVDVALGPLRKLLSENELKKHLKESPGGRTLKAVRTT